MKAIKREISCYSQWETARKKIEVFVRIKPQLKNLNLFSETHL